MKSSTLGFLMLGVVTAVGAIAIAIVYVSNDPEAPLLEASRQRVLRHIKHPLDATFLGRPRVSRGSQTIAVTGAVRSPNDFGAVLTKIWHVEWERGRAGSQDEPLRVTLDDEILFSSKRDLLFD